MTINVTVNAKRIKELVDEIVPEILYSGFVQETAVAIGRFQRCEVKLVFTRTGRKYDDEPLPIAPKNRCVKFKRAGAA